MNAMSSNSKTTVGFHTALCNDFHLIPEHAEQLASYYVLHWTLEHTIRVIQKDSYGQILHNGVRYVPIFKAGCLEGLAGDRILRISFRESTLYQKASANIPNYVLIKPLGSKE